MKLSKIFVDMVVEMVIDDYFFGCGYVIGVIVCFDCDGVWGQVKEVNNLGDGFWVVCVEVILEKDQYVWEVSLLDF